MDIKETRILAVRDIMRGGVSFYGWIHRPYADTTTRQVFSAVKLENHDICQTETPFMALTQESAQKLFDSLWECGCRPEEMTESVGELKATKEHLKDFRKLVGKAHGVDL